MLSYYRAASMIGVAFMVLIPWTAAEAQQPTTTVRGRVEWMTPQGQHYGAAFVNVTLGDNSGQTKFSQAVTARDGAYYFYRIRPGSYLLQISVPSTSAPLKYRIQALPLSYTDIRPIVIAR